MWRNLAGKTYVHIVLIAAIGLIVYSNTFHVPFQWDDKLFIEDNPYVKSLSLYLNSPKDESSEAYTLFKRRPIGYLTFALNYMVHGLNVTGYHIANISIHLFNAVLVYLLVILTFRTPFLNDLQLKEHHRYMALFAALLFVSHPIQTEAVTYVMGRLQLLMSFFYLSSIVLYIKWKESQAPFYKRAFVLYLLSLLSAVLAMKTKENAFTLPIAIALYEIFFFDGKSGKRILYLVPFLLTLFVIPLLFLHGDIAENDTAWRYATASAVSQWDYLLTQFRVIVTYIRLLFLPVNQNFDYDYPLFGSFFNPQVFLSFFLLTGLLVFAVFLFYRSRRTPGLRIISFGILWFFLALSVESSIFPIPMLICEYRVYLPSVGIIMLVIYGATTLLTNSRKEKNILIVSMILVVVVLSYAAHARNAVWSDETTFWADVVKKSPSKAGSHLGLALAYMKKGDANTAIEHYKSSLTLNPHNANAHYGLGMAYQSKGLEDNAVDCYQTALKTYDDSKTDFRGSIYLLLGNIYYSKGEVDRAIEDYLLSSKLKPSETVHYNLSVAYGAKGMADSAIEHARKAVQLKPDYAEAYTSLGSAYLLKGDSHSAIAAYKKALELKPDYEVAHFNLGRAYHDKGLFDEAAKEMEATLVLNKNHGRARALLNSIDRERDNQKKGD